MAKIRAYKLAEELGIDRNEFVERAAALGIPLKSAMASLDEAEVEKLRKKLGGVRASSGAVTESRVGGDTGSAVIRRRKKAAPEPVPVIEPVAPPAPIVTQVAPPPVVSEPIPEPEPEPIPEPIQVAEVARAPGPLVPQEPIDSDDKRGRPTGPGRAATAAAESAERAAKERKRVREVVNLREQENLARQATSRTLARRQVSLEPRATVSPRRRRRDAPVTEKPAAQRAAREEKRVVRVEGSATVGELARMLGVKAAAVQRELMKLGTMVSVNQSIDLETARSVGAGFGFEVQDVAFREQDFFDDARPAETASGARGATADHHRDGPRRPRQDVAARCDPQDRRRRRGSRRDHAAHRRLPGADRREEAHLHRHARPRRLHGDARPRRPAHRHRGARGRRERGRDAPDRRGDRPRPLRRRADRGRRQQVSICRARTRSRRASD